MKSIEKDELYEHLSQFLKSKGIEMKNGTYAQTLQKSCSFLADAVNLTQKGVEKAKDELDKRLDQMRQVIHEKTAPKAPPVTSAAARPVNSEQTPASQPAVAKARRRTKSKSRKRTVTARSKRKK